MVKAERARGAALRDAAKLAGWSALMAPLSVLLHETGHFAVARTLGFPARLRVASISDGAELGQAPDWMVASQAAAGPIVTLALVLVAARLYARDPTRLWALALAAAAPVRFLVTGAYLGALILVALRGSRFGGTPNFDEYNAAMAMGVPALPIAAAVTVLLAVFWIWLARSIPRGRRTLFILAIAVGAVTGMYLWMEVGPSLLAAVQPA